MAHKWTDEQKAKFRRTMAAKNEPKVQTVEVLANKQPHPDMLPIVELNDNGEDAEFAAAFAAAWRAYKGH